MFLSKTDFAPLQLFCILYNMAEKKPAKLIIVSNRLPVKAEIQDDTIIFEKSAGGPGHRPRLTWYFKEKHWIGWPGIYTSEPETEGNNWFTCIL
jgi:trehalose-6-phosphate synthase